MRGNESCVAVVCAHSIAIDSTSREARQMSLHHSLNLEEKRVNVRWVSPRLGRLPFRKLRHAAGVYSGFERAQVKKANEGL